MIPVILCDIIWFLQIASMLRYLYCKDSLLLPCSPCTRQPPKFCTLAGTLRPDLLHNPTYIILKSFLFYIICFTFQTNELYASWKKNLSWEMWNAMWKRVFSFFLFSSSSKGDNSRCLRASQMEQVLSNV